MIYNQKACVILKLIRLLYTLPGCGSGGLCHIVTDDDNIKDVDLLWVINYCNKPENANRVDAEISALICILLLNLNYDQRVCLFDMINSDYVDDELDEEKWDYYFVKVRSYEDIIKAWED